MDGSNALEAAHELFRQRNFSQVVATCRAQLATHADDVDLRILLARALMALRRDVEAQVEVSQCLRQRPRCPEAYQLLGELAFRRDELRAAEIFLKEALRLNAGDAHSRVLLDIIQAMTKPAAAAAKLPAASAAAGPSPTAAGSSPGLPAAVEPAPRPGLVLPPRRRRRATEAERTALVLERDGSAVIRLAGGFGEYLVYAGVISRAQLFNILVCHYTEGHKVGKAAVKLGFLSDDAVEEHAKTYHANRGPGDHARAVA